MLLNSPKDALRLDNTVGMLLGKYMGKGISSHFQFPLAHLPHAPLPLHSYTQAHTSSALSILFAKIWNNEPFWSLIKKIKLIDFC